MKKQGLLNKKIIIAYEFQSPPVTGRSKLRPYGMAFLLREQTAKFSR
jgi:hypothetical protein